MSQANRFAGATILAAALASAGASAVAAPVSGSYKGTIVADSDLGLVGMTMYADFTYDDAVAPGSTFLTLRTAMFDAPILSLSVRIGANVWAFDPINGGSFAEQTDDGVLGSIVEDRFDFSAYTFAGPDLVSEPVTPDAYSFSLYLWDEQPANAPDALSDFLALPAVAPVPEQFQTQGLHLMQFSFFTGDPELGDRYFIETGPVSTASPVPVPAAFWLLGTGLAATGLLRRRK
ncbi:MAG: VPLPA-CTERM sorting domain-containing protein [Gammaproteobacteria bacterium]